MKVLYYGEANLVYQQMGHISKSIKELLNKADIDFVQPENEGHCVEGLAPFGFLDEAERQARMFLEAVEKSGADIVVTPYAASYSGWAKENPEKFGLSLPIPIEHILVFLAKHFKEHKPEFNEVNMRLAFHDGCTLGRKFGFGDEIRDLVRMVPGVEIVELVHPNEGMGGTDHKDWSTCPGAWLHMLVPELAPLLGANVIENEILPLNVQAVSSTCANAVAALAGAIMENKFPIRPMFLTELLNEAWR